LGGIVQIVADLCDRYVRAAQEATQRLAANLYRDVVTVELMEQFPQFRQETGGKIGTNVQGFENWLREKHAEIDRLTIEIRS